LEKEVTGTSLANTSHQLQMKNVFGIHIMTFGY